MSDLRMMAVLTALNKMMRDGYFSICTIDTCAKLLNVSPNHTEAYRILHALHCVHFCDMPEPLRVEVPELIKDCLRLEQPFMFKTLEPEKPARKGLLRFLTEGFTQ